MDEDVSRRNHALLDSSRHFEEEDMRSPEEIAKAVARRHRDRAAPYTGDMNEIPQRLLMPSVHDASLWQVRVKVRHFQMLPETFFFKAENLSIARPRTRDRIQSHAKSD